MRIVQRLLSLAGIGVVVWVCVTTWDAVLHGHPAYLVLLAVTLLGALIIGWRSFRAHEPARGWRLALGIVGAVLAVGWLVAVAWLKPFGATGTALAAMLPTGTATVSQSPTQVVMQPKGESNGVGLLFQPGARVDARAYAAILRPLVDAGFTVVIPKQPLGIAFLATGAFESARDAYPDITSWVVGGHSLGGTVAAMDADEHDGDERSPVTGLLLYASYPASDISTTLTADALSIYGTKDGLATPFDIERTAALLPPEAGFIPIEGAVHSFFGDYGPQPGDGTPTITHDEARAQIGVESLAFLESLQG
jgi:hypothetical protein